MIRRLPFIFNPRNFCTILYYLVFIFALYFALINWLWQIMIETWPPIHCSTTYYVEVHTIMDRWVCHILYPSYQINSNKRLGWLGVTLVTVIMKCCLLYRWAVLPPLPGTPPPLFKILAIDCSALVRESVDSRYDSYVN